MNRQIITISTVLAVAGTTIYGCDQADIESMFRGTPEFVPDNDEPNCLDRQGEVVGSGGSPASMRGFVPDALRWAAADVGPSTRAGHQGVNTVGNDERGQEYVEYYAVVSPNLISDTLDAKPIALGQLEEGGRSVSDNALPSDVATALEDAEDGSKTVGACIFHSWHADIQRPLPACGESGCLEQPPAEGADSNFPYSEYAVPLELTPENFRMKVSFNSNRAAADLVEQCFRGTNTNGDPIIPEFAAGKNSEDPFFRGCMGAANLFGTEWRRSDPSVCTAANRLRECGCSIPGLTDGLSLGKAAKAVGDAVVPPEGKTGSYRGFGLGGWPDSDPKALSSTPLMERLRAPAGCRYVNIGEDSKTVMACRLTVDDFLEDVDDPKETCREKYGMDVVVHVPIPGGAISCDPDESDANASCGEMPWNVGFEGEAEEEEPAPKKHNCFNARKGKGCTDDTIQTCVCGEGEGRFGDEGCCAKSWDTKCVSEAEACAAQAE
jgi:hypothetical protein